MRNEVMKKFQRTTIEINQWRKRHWFK